MNLPEMRPPMRQALKPLLPVSGLILSVLVAYVVAMLIVVPLVMPPMQDVILLFVFMSSSGGLTVLLAYLLYRRGMTRWFTSLRWTLLATCVLNALVVFVNVWLTAQLMFISQHDLILTSALLVFGGIVSVIAVYFVSSTLIERIHTLALAFRRLSGGELHTRLGIDGRDELAQLAISFNEMADALQTMDREKRQLEQARRDLIAWVSHDLRTPLATIRAMNEAILDGVASDPQTVTRYLENTQKEVQHLSHLIEDLFELTQLETGHLTLAKQKASLRDLISDTLGSLTAQAEANGVLLTGQVADGVDVLEIAPDKIQRVLYNLLDNALRHTPPAGKIMLSAQRCPSGGVEISIHNTGSSIAPHDLPHIFERFYRGEPSRARSESGQRGTGLGLAIVRGLVEAHGGTISVESTPETGTTFTVVLPG
ncbi:MAG: ATP-binding protein [bacterium]|nr:ATP-binding protein [bacterium]